MPLTAGSTLGPYVIEAPLGAGGMGEVYRARDPRLNRTVAIKVLSARLTDSPQFRKRFEREARAIAALEHPHICPLYDVGTDGDTSFLVMQHLHGETLADILKRGPLPVDHAIHYAVEIAGALHAAHRAGVVHRDLKPANVMVTKNGVRLLDFGLARVDGGEAAGEGQVGATTISAALTDEGALWGTLPYMAPEQVEGRTADARTDIFALGAVLYEMATGRRAFSGASQASLMAAIMSAEPPLVSASRDGVPPGLDRVVKRCLAKDPDARWQNAGDLAAELQWIGEQAEDRSVPAVRHRDSRPAWAIGAVLAAGAAAAAAWMLKPAPPEPATASAHLTIDMPPGAVLENFSRPVLALSPDGRQLVYAATLNGTPYLFLREIDRLESKALTETDLSPHPFFSPDGNWVGFQIGVGGRGAGLEISSSGALKRIAVGGGAPVTIASGIEFLTGASWSADDRIVFVAGIRAPISGVAASGGAPQQLTTFDGARGESSHRYPELLPGGRAVMFLAGPPADGPWYEASLVAQSLETGQRHSLIHGSAQAHYVPPGYVAYARAGTLYAVPFDEQTLRVTGPSVAVLEGVREDPRHGSAQFAVSANGTLAYVSGGLETTEVVLVNREGRATPLMPEERRWFGSPKLSPNGRWLAVTVGAGDDATFVYDIAQGGGLRRVTFDANHLSHTWTPDGKRVTTVKSATGEVVSNDVDRRGPEEVLYRSDTFQPNPGSWAPNGRVLVFAMNGDLWKLTLPEQRVEPLIASRFSEGAPSISPDGKWLAYTSNESGQYQVYVQQFPAAGQRWMVSKAGGSEPVWARDSNRLYFRRGRKLLTVAGRPPFREPVELFEVPWAPVFDGPNSPQYDVAPDGEGFIMVRASDRAAARIHVILNWVEEVKRRVPR